MDYKELIRQLRNCKSYKPKYKLQSTMLDAATAIETLLAERDAAIQDLGATFTCLTCANSMEQTGKPCEFGADCMGQYWRWRGPKKGGAE